MANLSSGDHRLLVAEAGALHNKACQGHSQLEAFAQNLL